ncbi:glycerol-3-phosphate acyltransferase PlsY [Chryseomicrobium aureum]|uniref:glycerol-3-phosphate acyltransferase n=1 Tax=Chryseomicrobium aureum TaxID=1441723 RepID=UPI001956B799|nr:glycerol-3-phosphate acyltransferase [Chryseomicrobium aureum]MBM7705943.1 glycerol-3-phosphate acyltransferase PlsY [Chryseomicrobium aureum]
MIEMIYWIASYFVGTVLTAWFVGKWKGVDLREHKSGNLGARNAGTVLGKDAFIVTFLGDAGKGALIVWIGHLLNLPTTSIAIGAVAVTLGHLFPLWLKGRGGKGIATFIGVALAFHPISFLAVIGVMLIGLVITRSATLSMNLAFPAYAIALAFENVISSALFFLLIVIILWRHRFDTKESWDDAWWHSK